MAGKFEKKRRRRKKRIGAVALYILLPLLCGVLFGAWMISNLPGFSFIGNHEETLQQTDSQTQYDPPTEPVETWTQAAETQQSTEPVTKLATATIGATGDILMHDLVIKSGYDAETGGYNYDNIFKWFSKYVSAVDYAATNLETTLCGDKNGYPYAGYPNFNSPDEIVDAVKNAGFDLLLTANNHAYDTKYTGFKRTQQVIAERELDHVGTRLGKDDKTYVVRDINGIKVGMTCYTYCSGYNNAKNFKLNNVSLSEAASERINAFHYKDLNTFYMKLAGEMQQMKSDGAEAIILFIHWGTEYETTYNETQKKMAQKLCDLGVDVIVGSHSHVAQPVELLTSSTFDAHKTLCVYSVGKVVSNIYGNQKYPVHTEDGMLLTVTFAKYSDGTVITEKAEVLPIWVRRYEEQDVQKFQVLTMATGADWKSEMGLDDELVVKCQESYDRTMEIVGEGLNTANTWFAQRQQQTETALGIQ